MKICPVVAELFHADGRTDMMKVMDAFRGSPKANKNEISHARSTQSEEELKGKLSMYLENIG